MALPVVTEMIQLGTSSRCHQGQWRASMWPPSSSRQLLNLAALRNSSFWASVERLKRHVDAEMRGYWIGMRGYCNHWLLFQPTRSWTGGSPDDDRHPGPLMTTWMPPDGLLVDHSAPPFRYWIDQVLWSQGKVAAELVDEVFQELGGAKTGGPACSEGLVPLGGDVQAHPITRSRHKVDRGQGALGCCHVDRWDLLWSKSTYALAAARALSPGQLVSAVVGLNCLTMKKRMLLTLTAAYGEGAFDITPRSFALPEELHQWCAWVKAGKDVASELWILKTGQDAGKGLQLLPVQQAIRLAQAQTSASTARSTAADGCATASASRSSKHQLQVAQLYVAQPLLLLGHKWHLRLWVVVTGIAPLRAYLHGYVPQNEKAIGLETASAAAAFKARRGLVLFSSETYNAAQSQDLGAGYGALARGHVTNYARNADGMVWALEELQRHLGAEPYCTLWSALVTATARAVHAASRPMTEAHAWLRPAIPDYGFQMVGVDYLVDVDLHPWLLEFNSSPSIMARHTDVNVQQLISKQKKAMLRDMAGLVLHRVRRGAGSNNEGGHEAGKGGNAMAVPGVGGWRVELSHLGEFIELMSHFPKY